MQDSIFNVCSKCGCYCDRRFKNLAAPCMNKPFPHASTHGKAKHILLGMLSGKHPDATASRWPDGALTNYNSSPSRVISATDGLDSADQCPQVQDFQMHSMEAIDLHPVSHISQEQNVTDVAMDDPSNQGFSMS